jgi:hypothetical protein
MIGSGIKRKTSQSNLNDDDVEIPTTSFKRGRILDDDEDDDESRLIVDEQQREILHLSRQIDENLEQTASIYNLSAINVKSILHVS